MTVAAAKDGELRHFDAKQIFLEASVGEEIYRGISGVPEGMELLKEIYGLVQAGRCLFDIFYDDRVEQLEADSRVFGKFDDGRHPCSRPSDDGEVFR